MNLIDIRLPSPIRYLTLLTISMCFGSSSLFARSLLEEPKYSQEWPSYLHVLEFVSTVLPRDEAALFLDFARQHECARLYENTGEFNPAYFARRQNFRSLADKIHATLFSYPITSESLLADFHMAVFITRENSNCGHQLVDDSVSFLDKLELGMRADQLVRNGYSSISTFISGQAYLVRSRCQKLGWTPQEIFILLSNICHNQDSSTTDSLWPRPPLRPIAPARPATQGDMNQRSSEIRLGDVIKDGSTYMVSKIDDPPHDKDCALSALNMTRLMFITMIREYAGRVEQRHDVKALVKQAFIECGVATIEEWAVSFNSKDHWVTETQLHLYALITNTRVVILAKDYVSNSIVEVNDFNRTGARSVFLGRVLGLERSQPHFMRLYLNEIAGNGR